MLGKRSYLYHYFFPEKSKRSEIERKEKEWEGKGREGKGMEGEECTTVDLYTLAVLVCVFVPGCSYLYLCLKCALPCDALRYAMFVILCFAPGCVQSTHQPLQQHYQHSHTRIDAPRLLMQYIHLPRLLPFVFSPSSIPPSTPLVQIIRARLNRLPRRRRRRRRRSSALLAVKCQLANRSDHAHAVIQRASAHIGVEDPVVCA